MSITDIQAIDVHGHFGEYGQFQNKLVDRFLSGDTETVCRRARQSNIALTVVSPLKALLPRLQGNVAVGNEEAAELVGQTDGLLQWAVVHPPQPESFDQVARMLSLPKCVGIKILPIDYGWDIREHGREVFEFAAKHRAIVLTHSGDVHSMPEDFVAFADDFPEVRLIVAHLGNRPDADPSHQVRAILAAKHGNIFVDTSSSQSIMPGLIEWAADEVGPERILFGTDTPVYDVAMQRARINNAEISDHAKRLILRENALSLFDLDVRHLRPTASRYG